MKNLFSGQVVLKRLVNSRPARRTLGQECVSGVWGQSGVLPGGPHMTVKLLFSARFTASH